MAMRDAAVGSDDQIGEHDLFTDDAGWPKGARSGRRSPLSSLFSVLVGLIVAASFGVWVYAYSGFADRPPPDLLADTDIAVQAEAFCAAALADVAAMPAAQDAADGMERAAQVRLTTSRFAALIDDLGGIQVDDADDQVIMNGWLSDWRTLLQDRLRYADAVTEDGDAIFLLTNVAAAERLDRRITRVANTNRMPSCATPADVG